MEIEGVLIKDLEFYKIEFPDLNKEYGDYEISVESIGTEEEKMGEVK